MADWQEFLQSVIIGVIFSFLLAKLFSIIFTFRQDNLRITRSQSQTELEPESDDEQQQPLILTDEKSGEVEKEPLILTDDEINSDSDDDDDWEGVESTELDETFSAATAFVAATAADRNSMKVSNELQLQLYGLYKIATEGPCSSPQPSALKMTARAKWQAWKKLGAMPPEEAMEQYIDIVSGLYPTWGAGSATKKRSGESSDASHGGSKGPMGPVFSSFIYEEEPGSEFKLEAIHAFAREGDEDKLAKCIESGVPLNLKDSEGRTPLHWAVDRGHMNTTSLLLKNNADINAKDNEGQTALHYAAVCERADMAEFLVKNGADIEVKDDEGNTASDLCDTDWPWMHGLATAAESTDQ